MKSWFHLPVHALRHVVRIPLADQAILAEAGLLLAFARLAVVSLPFRVLAQRFGTPAAAEGLPDPVPGGRAVLRVRWAVRTVAVRTRWSSSSCLPQAMAARVMLKRRGIPTTLHLGVRQNPNEGLSAHAWLHAGSIVVTGKPGHLSFAEVARFA